MDDKNLFCLHSVSGWSSDVDMCVTTFKVEDSSNSEIHLPIIKFVRKVSIQLAFLSVLTNMPLEVVKIQKGKDQIRYNGHLFGLNLTMKDGKLSWRCTYYSKSGCAAKIHTDHEKNEIVNVHGQHNHVADAAKIESKVIVNQLRGRARDTQEQPDQIIAAVTAGKYSNSC